MPGVVELEKVASAPPESRRAYWADRIRGCWFRSVQGILETGRELLNAREDIQGHGESWEAFADQDLPFTGNTADRLIRIAEHPILGDGARGHQLPASWRTLSELARLPEERLQEALDSGRVGPKTERADVLVLRREWSNRPAVKEEGKLDWTGVPEPLAIVAGTLIEWLFPYKGDPVWGSADAAETYIFGLSFDDLCRLAGLNGSALRKRLEPHREPGELSALKAAILRKDPGLRRADIQTAVLEMLERFRCDDGPDLPTA